MPRASPQGCIQPQFAGNITLAGDWRRQTHLHTSHGPRGCCRGGLPLLIVVFQPSVCLFSPISPNHRRRDGTPEGRLPLGWRTGIHRFPDKSGATQSGIKPAAVYAFTRATTNEGLPGADGLEFNNVYARDCDKCGIVTNESYEIYNDNVFLGNTLRGSVNGQMVDGAPTLYRGAFSTTITSIRVGPDQWRVLNLSIEASARFQALHELSHLVISGSDTAAEIAANNWALERM